MPNAQTQGRAVMFDAVGTLIYADPPVPEVYQTVARSHGVQLSRAEITGRIKSAVAAHFAKRTDSSESIERSRWQAVVADVVRGPTGATDSIFADLWRHFATPTAWQLFPDVEDCLTRLQQAGVHVAIASNFDARLRQVCRGHAALRGLDIYCSSDIGFAKPSAGFFRGIEERLQLPAQALTMVGDDLAADHHGALAAGWNSVHLVRETGTSTGDSITSLAELPALLAKDLTF